MCGRFAFGIDRDEVAHTLNNQTGFPSTNLVLDSSDSVPKNFTNGSYNVSPTNYTGVLYNNNNESIHVNYMKFGFPRYNNPGTMINARIENITTFATWKKALNSKNPEVSGRCIVPIQGYFEWKSQDNVKQPYYVTNESLIFLLGLYKYSEKSNSFTFSIITGPFANSIEWLHERSPVMISPTEITDWLKGDFKLKDLLDKSRTELGNELKWWKVTKEVGNVKSFGKYLVEPWKERKEFEDINSFFTSPKKKAGSKKDFKKDVKEEADDSSKRKNQESQSPIKRHKIGKNGPLDKFLSPKKSSVKKEEN